MYKERIWCKITSRHAVFLVLEMLNVFHATHRNVYRRLHSFFFLSYFSHHSEKIRSEISKHHDSSKRTEKKNEKEKSFVTASFALFDIISLPFSAILRELPHSPSLFSAFPPIQRRSMRCSFVTQHRVLAPFCVSGGNTWRERGAADTHPG